MHYRAAGYPVRAGEPPNDSYLAIVGVADSTQVTVTLPSRGAIRAGDGVDAVPFGGTATFTLNLGDVVELLASNQTPSDFNGTTIDAAKPVQVFTGHPCAFNPSPNVWCDHLEASLASVDHLGDHYVVPVPSHPLAGVPPGGHSVFFVGAFDGTDLVYAPAPPPGTPLHLGAGAFVDVGLVTSDFDVQATRPFVLDASFGTPQDTSEFGTQCLFLAPPGYDRAIADVVAPLGADLVLDGVKSAVVPTPIPGTGFATHRLELGGGSGGPHLLTSVVPVGVQVMGYANAQSYYYAATGVTK
jgi:hypothetical protein